MDSVANSTRRPSILPRVLVIVGWLILGALGARQAVIVLSRPANSLARRVELEPKAGGYGPVQLSVTSLPGVAEALVLVNARNAEPFFVTLPDRRLLAVDDAPATRADGPTAFTVDE